MKLSEIHDRRIFITGGTGFFGKSLLQHPVVESSYVVLLSRNPQHLVDELPNLKNSNNIEFIEGDVRHFNSNDFDFDYIIHGAATSGRIIPDDEMKSVVTEGSKRVIEFARRNHNLSRLLYISSGAVYGNRHDGSISEDMSCEPGNVYSSAKIKADQYCALGNIPYCIARCFAFVGEYLPLDEHFAIGNFIRDCLENRNIIRTLISDELESRV